MQGEQRLPEDVMDYFRAKPVLWGLAAEKAREEYWDRMEERLDEARSDARWERLCERWATKHGRLK